MLIDIFDASEVKATVSRKDIAASQYPPVKENFEIYVEKTDTFCSDVSNLYFLPPLHQIGKIVGYLVKLQKDRNCEYCVVINNIYLDLPAIRNLRLLHEMKEIQSEVQKENEWLEKINLSITQPCGTPVLSVDIASTFKSMLQTKSEGYFWPNMKLKTCEIKRLAVNRWVSDLISHY